jgi:hypothetical protein
LHGAIVRENITNEILLVAGGHEAQRIMLRIQENESVIVKRPTVAKTAASVRYSVVTYVVPKKTNTPASEPLKLQHQAYGDSVPNVRLYTMAYPALLIVAQRTGGYVF